VGSYRCLARLDGRDTGEIYKRYGEI